MEQKKFEELVENLFHIAPLFKKKMVKQDLYGEEADLSPSHFHILFTLEETGDSAVSELARILMISKPNITPLIQKLIDREFVERSYNEKDRRYIHIKLTGKGKEFIENHKKMVIDNLRSKISGFSEEDLNKLAASLEGLKQVLNKME